MLSRYSLISFYFAMLSLSAFGREKHYEILIDHECRPASMLTKITLAASSKSDVRKFWSEQKVAIAQSIEQALRNSQYRQSEREIDAQIRELEMKKDDERFRSLGMVNPQRTYPVPPEFQENLDRADNVLKKVESDIMLRRLKWANKCLTYADDQIRR